MSRLPPQHPDELPASFGRYRLMKLLGKGGMGSVFLAHDPQLDRSVALKVPQLSATNTASVLARFTTEARAAAALQHPNICPIHEVGEIDGIPYLTMAFVEGKALGEYAMLRPPLPRQSAALVRKLALALDEAHRRGVVHRDLKPANVMIDRRGEPIIMDFGLARRARPGDPRLTQEGACLGTPAYMPPEQVKGEIEALGPASDIYSLGVILYELLARRLPFTGDVMALLIRVVTEEPPPPSQFCPDLDPELEAICLKAMAKKVAERYSSMAVFAGALTDYLRGKPVSVPDATAPPASAVRSPAPAAAGRTEAEGIRASQMGGLRSVANLHAELRGPKEEEDKPRRSATVVESSNKARRRKRRRSRKQPWVLCTCLLAFVPVAVVLAVWLSRRGSAPASAGALAQVPVPGGPASGTSPTPRSEIAPPGIPPAQLKEGTKKAQQLPAIFTNGLGMELVLVPKGKSWLGGGGGREGNQEVEIAQDFYLGKYEVTQEEWQKVMGKNPSSFQVVAGVKPEEQKRFPVENVSWNGAQRFMTELNKRERKVGWVYRLPKKQEWEYAYRGGPMADRAESAHDFYIDKPTNELTVKQANIGFEVGQGLGRTCKVGSYPPNRLGLYDMHGNVFEWCEEGARGGSWRSAAGWCKASEHGRGFRQNELRDECGFRVSRVPVASPLPQPDKIALPKEEEPSVLKPDDKGIVTRTPTTPAPAIRLPDPKELASRACAADALKREALPKLLQEQGPPELVAVLGAPQFRLRGGDPGWSDFSPDGKLLAAPSGQDVLLFDAATGFPRRTLTGHGKNVLAVAFSKDGKHLASGDDLGEVRLWTVAGDRPPRLLKGHQGNVERVAFAPDSAVLATAGADRIIRLWKVIDGTACGTLAGHTGMIYSLAFSPNGKFLASGGNGDGMRVWDVARRKELWKPDLPGGGYTSVAFSPDGKALAAGVGNGTRVWNFGGKVAFRRERFTARVPGEGLLAFTPDGKELLTAPFHSETEKVVVRLNVATGQKTGGFTVPGFPGWARFGISRDAATLALAETNGGRALRVLDAATGKPRFAPVGHLNEAHGVAFSPNGQLLASAGSDNTVRLWDLASGKEVQVLAGHTSMVLRLAFHPNGQTLASGSWDNTVRLWNAVTGDRLGVLKHPAHLANVAYSPDGRLLATTCWDGRVRLWSTATHKEVQSFPAHGGIANGVVFHPSGRELASSGIDGLVKIWDVKTGVLQHVARGHDPRSSDGSRHVIDLETLPDGSRLVSTGDDGTVRIWSWRDGKLLHTLRTVGGPAGKGNSVRVRPDGGLLAAAGTDGALHLWGLTPGPTRPRVIRLFSPGTLQGWFFAGFSPEGRYVATGNPDGTIYLLRLADRGSVLRVPD
jgi:WD40 repeat protein/serine/threonine protein kinase/formylglycine-generating enzyme required for sulfatase activity